MDVNGISQGGLAASGMSQTINSEKITNTSSSKAVNTDSNNGTGNHKAVTEQQIKKVVEKMSKLLDEENTHVEYEAHKGMWNVVIKIIDNKTNEIVTQIPGEQAVAAMDNFYNSIGLGLIMDKKA